MALFSKKPPCPVCGGKISWFLPTKIEGETICDDCSQKIDMEEDLINSLTMQKFKEYLMFYEQNKELRESFVISEKIDFGLWDTKLIFDYENKLFCLSKNPDKTVFQGGELKSFSIKEDSSLLYEGTPDKLVRYTSTVPERALAVAPQIDRFMMNQRLNRTLRNLDKDKSNYNPAQYFTIPAPFKEYIVELRFEHPYWRSFKCDMSGPSFSSSNPDVNDYLRDYHKSQGEIEKLVRALMNVAFPNAVEQLAGHGIYGVAQGGANFSAPPADAFEEIKKFKSLLDEGIITKEEFEAKKKQLMGI